MLIIVLAYSMVMIFICKWMRAIAQRDAKIEKIMEGKRYNENT
jgi:hypothetical protein